MKESGILRIAEHGPQAIQSIFSAKRFIAPVDEGLVFHIRYQYSIGVDKLGWGLQVLFPDDQVIEWLRFYPMSESDPQKIDPRLQRKGIGTLAQLKSLQELLQMGGFGDWQDYTVRHSSPISPAFQNQLRSMGIDPMEELTMRDYSKRVNYSAERRGFVTV